MEEIDMLAAGSSDSEVDDETAADVAAATPRRKTVDGTRFSSYLEHGPVPEGCQKGVECCLGIDEAGRGPVLGPMVYGAAYWPVKDDEELSNMGFDDSKALTHESRSKLLDKLKECKRIGYVTLSIPPQEISAKMMRKSPYNLNAISHDAAVTLVRTALAADVNITEVYVDTVGHAGKYEAYLTRVFQNKIKFTVRAKADSIYKVVSAASICAKVARDYEVQNWKFTEKGIKPEGPLGCGYPGDSKTKAWMRNNMDPVFGFPSIVRFSWSTSAKMLLNDDKAMEVEWEEEEDEEVGASIVGFFGNPNAGKPKRCPLLTDCGMELVKDF